MTTQPSRQDGDGLPFQKRVLNWLMECFSMDICRDGTERNHRFLEEALELVQALGCTCSEAHQLVDYVFDRPAGEPMQELGGVQVTLAALCFPHDLDMHEAAERELARVWTKIDKIRAKQAAKPKHSPLPSGNGAEGTGPHRGSVKANIAYVDLPAPPQPAPDAMREALAAKIRSAYRLTNYGHTDKFCWSLSIDEQETIATALSAPPVPSHDGARVALQNAQHCIARETLRTIRLEQAIRDSVEALERNSTSAPVVECLKASLSASGTGAAEPGAVIEEAMWMLQDVPGDTLIERIARLTKQYLDLITAPPVRGDREALRPDRAKTAITFAKIIFGNRGDTDEIFWSHLEDEGKRIAFALYDFSLKLEWPSNLSLPSAPVSDDPLAELVSRFSKALLAKLKLAQANGRSGWERDDWEKQCQQGLLRHIEKGDPRDVAAYCAFIWHHGWIVAAPVSGRDAVIEECKTIALEQRCERGTPWDLACTTIAEKIGSLSNHKESGR